MNWKSCRDGWWGRMGLTVEPVMDKGIGDPAVLPGPDA